MPYSPIHYTYLMLVYNQTVIYKFEKSQHYLFVSKSKCHLQTLFLCIFCLMCTIPQKCSLSKSLDRSLTIYKFPIFFSISYDTHEIVHLKYFVLLIKSCFANVSTTTSILIKALFQFKHIFA